MVSPLKNWAGHAIQWEGFNSDIRALCHLKPHSAGICLSSLMQQTCWNAPAPSSLRLLSLCPHLQSSPNRDYKACTGDGLTKTAFLHNCKLTPVSLLCNNCPCPGSCDTHHPNFSSPILDNWSKWLCLTQWSLQIHIPAGDHSLHLKVSVWIQWNVLRMWTALLHWW